MKMQVTTPAPSFNPVTVELTFESLEELLALKTTLGMTNGSSVYHEVIDNEEKTSGLTQSLCGDITCQQFDFFDELYKSLAK